MTIGIPTSFRVKASLFPTRQRNPFEMYIKSSLLPKTLLWLLSHFKLTPESSQWLPRPFVICCCLFSDLLPYHSSFCSPTAVTLAALQFLKLSQACSYLSTFAPAFLSAWITFLPGATLVHTLLYFLYIFIFSVRPTLTPYTIFNMAT